MNRTYCGGKFLLKEEMDAEEAERRRKIDLDVEAKELSSMTKEDRKDLRKCRDFGKRAAEALFRHLKSIGHGAYDVKTEDGCPSDRMTVVSFRVKGRFLRSYRFGMWIHADRFFAKGCGEVGKMDEAERNRWESLDRGERVERGVVIELFQCHEDSIDKFRPSRCAPVIRFGKDDVRLLLKRDGKKASEKRSGRTEGDVWNFAFLALHDLIRFMERHPVLHYCGLLGHGDLLASYFRMWPLSSPLLNFLKDRVARRVKSAKDSAVRRLGKRAAVRMCRSLARERCVESVTMENFTKSVMPGCVSECDYEISVRFGYGFSLDECSDAFDRHVKRTNIGRYGEWRCVAKVLPNGISKSCRRVDTDGCVVDTLSLVNWCGRDVERKMAKDIPAQYGDMKEAARKGRTLRKFLKDLPDAEAFAARRGFDLKAKRLVRFAEYMRERDGKFVTVWRQKRRHGR